MKIVYNLERLETLIHTFSSLTNLDILITDSDLNPLVQNANRCLFCNLIGSTAKGHSKCEHSDKDLIRKCSISQQIESHICHAGLTDIIVPIRKDSLIFGYIFFGRIRSEIPFSQVYARVSQLGYDCETLEKAFLELHTYTSEEIRNISEIISSLALHIMTENMINTEHMSTINSCIAYIDRNLESQLSVDILCHVMNISKNVLYKLFRNTFDCTVNEYICRKRLDKAKHLLANTTLPIQKVAENCGIPNHSYFIRLMKKYEGMSPNAYRKNASAKK